MNVTVRPPLPRSQPRPGCGGALPGCVINAPLATRQRGNWAVTEGANQEVHAPHRWLYLKTVGAAAGLLSLLLLCGCSTFNRDWRHAATHPVASTSVEGRWEGRWLSEVNGHQGRLRCLMTRQSDERYLARFRATYSGILRFTYTVPLTLQAHDAGFEVNGEANLGKLAGGTYYYEGRITPANFPATYRSKHDHGIFELHRPE